MNKDDIKKALEVCTDCYSTCAACPYDDVGNCGDTLKTDACELIAEQEKEIERLKAENKQLKTECTLLDDELRIARHDTIDVLNKVKERAIGLAAIETYHICNLIDEMIEEYVK